MKYWLNAGFLDVGQLIPLAVAAERAGFEGVTMPDHLFFPDGLASKYPYSADGAVLWPPEAPWPDSWVAIAAMAQHTSRLRFSTGVYVAPLRDPFSLAKSIGTLAALTGDRLSCGFGAGWLQEEFDVVGIDFATRGARLDETLLVLRLLWSGEMVEHHGAHFDFGPLQMRPAAPQTSILIGGNSRAALRRAARNDGWIASFTSVDDVARMTAEVCGLRADAATGASDRPFQLAVTTTTPKVAREADALAAIGIESITVPAISLARSTATDDVVAGLDSFAARWLA